MINEINRKVVLKSRPDGYPKLSDFDIVEQPIPQPREGEGAHTLHMAFAGSVHARQNARRRVIRPIRGAWRCHRGRRCGARGGIAYARIRRRRNRGRPTRLAGIRHIRRAQPASRRRNARPAFHRARRIGNAGNDRLLRLPRHMRSQARRNRGGVRRVGRGRPSCWADSQNYGLLCCRHRRNARKGGLHRQRTWL